MLAAGYRIINLDESTISCSNFRRYSWRKQNDTAYVNKKVINPRINLVALVDNTGNKPQICELNINANKKKISD